MYLNFQDQFSVELIGEGKLYDSVLAYYRQLIESRPNSSSILRFHIGVDINSPEYILGDPYSFSGRSGENYIRYNDLERFEINHDWSYIQISDETALHNVFKLLEYRPRLQLAKSGSAMIHASGVNIEDTTIVFPAWRHTGKTNTLLTLLNQKNAAYLSDDRLWVDSHLNAHGYPMPINIEPYNNFLIRGDASSILKQYRYRLSHFLEEKTHTKSTFVQKAIYFFNQFYITPSSRKMDIDELIGGNRFVDKSRINSMIFLQSRPTHSNEPSVEIESISSSEAVRYLQTINEYEWNSYLRSICSSFDLLFQTDDNLNDLQTLEQAEAKIFRKVCGAIPTHILYLPQQYDWSDESLRKAVLDCINSVNN